MMFVIYISSEFNVDAQKSDGHYLVEWMGHRTFEVFNEPFSELDVIELGTHFEGAKLFFRLFLTKHILQKTKYKLVWSESFTDEGNKSFTRAIFVHPKIEYSAKEWCIQNLTRQQE